MSFFSPDVFGATWQNSIEFSLLSWQKIILLSSRNVSFREGPERHPICR